MSQAENTLSQQQKASSKPASEGGPKDEPNSATSISVEKALADKSAAAKTAAEKDAEQKKDPHKKPRKRSTGLRLFDVMLYPLITNVGVFVISVFATYLTTKGNLTNKGRKLDWKTDKLEEGEKLLYGATGKFFHQRGDWLMDKFEKMGMKDPKTREMSKMVFFSFADGSLMAPFVKMFEDRRERIGKWIDQKLDSEPDDPKVYKAEPKQSWLSVLGGRAATAVVVVSTAVVLERKVFKNTAPKFIIGEKMSLNDKMFHVPGAKLGEWISENPGVSKKFGKHDGAEIAKISIFEAFYTSVCTAGLYFSSRFFARKINTHKEKKLAQQQEAIVLPPTSEKNATQTETYPEHIQQSAIAETSTLMERLKSGKRPAPAAPATAASHLERAQNTTRDTATLSL